MTYQDVSQIKFCPECGAPVPPGARFRGKCGKNLQRK
ncbi:MAG: zinc-ribbon domain-containing protein [Clostridia bacterium]